ncbi:GNAT family N-acetyltransferase [Tengunoibacter tsumagoiensis]|uniref:GCN5 family N-acetyltransferase n=1 Tax=Tengunoibacter tsumagoiensis TaxID=2014871 RepID=A0A402A862_9CHLR|nr:GNAT family N-acetyltransferase [Tengunoibacter tsumagoiensis]GCE15185.1 GCN5 family N-acetyltransferase [Tengunoibacter tsumagoiensis]
MIVFETERILVRHLRDDDFEAFYALCSDPEIHRYMGDGKPLTAEQTRSWIQISQGNYRQRGYGCFAITSRLDSQMIGFGGIARPANNPHLEIIYALKPSCWGQGLASEFIKALLATSFERWQIPRLEATIDVRNHRSSKAIEKAGMLFVRSSVDEDGYTILWYALDRPDPSHM